MLTFSIVLINKSECGLWILHREDIYILQQTLIFDQFIKILTSLLK